MVPDSRPADDVETPHDVDQHLSHLSAAVDAAAVTSLTTTVP